MFPEKERSGALQRVVLPVLGTVVAILSILKDYELVASLALGVVAIALLSTYVEWVLGRVRHLGHRRRDERLLQSAQPTLRRFVFDFERFVRFDSRLPNPYVILFKREQSSSKPALNFEKLGLVHPAVLSGFLSVLMNRCKSNGVSGREVRENLEEFGTMLQLFHTWQVLAIYGNEAEVVRASITDKTKSELNAAREEYVYFLRRYDEFLRELNSNLHEKVVPWLPEVPNPL